MGRPAALVLLPALLLVGAGPAGTFFFCPSMQELMREACCPEEDEQTAGLRLEPEACCAEVTVAREVVPSQTAPRFSFEFVALALPLTLPSWETLLRPVALAADGSDGRTTTGPPILRVTQALLI